MKEIETFNVRRDDAGFYASNGDVHLGYFATLKEILKEIGVYWLGTTKKRNDR